MNLPAPSALELMYLAHANGRLFRQLFPTTAHAGEQYEPIAYRVIMAYMHGANSRQVLDARYICRAEGLHSRPPYDPGVIYTGF